MSTTIERVLAESGSGRLIVGDASWSGEDLLRAGEVLADGIARTASSSSPGPRLVTVAAADAVLIVAVLAAAERLGVPVLLADPESTDTGVGAVDDVLIGTSPAPGSSPVPLGAALTPHVSRRERGYGACVAGDSLLFQTSGSTAAPRAVVKPTAAALRDSVRIADHLHAGAASPVVVCAAPVFHSYGFTHGLVAGLIAGAETTFRSPSSSPAALARAVRRTGATTLVSLPTQLAMVAAARSLDLAGLRQATSAGAPLRPDTVTAISRDHGFRLLNAYGASELGTCTIVPMAAESAPGHIGPPLGGVEMRVDPADGELLVRNDSFATGYLSDGEFRALPLEDGWYRTGDLAEQGADGFRVTGRRGDVINIAGRKTRRSRIEAVLAAHPDVLEAQVIATEDEARGEVPVARVVVRPGHARPDILDWSRERLDPFELPRHVEWLDELPRSATGKVIYARAADTTQATPDRGPTG